MLPVTTHTQVMHTCMLDILTVDHHKSHMLSMDMFDFHVEHFFQLFFSLKHSKPVTKHMHVSDLVRTILYMSICGLLFSPWLPGPARRQYREMKATLNLALLRSSAGGLQKWRLLQSVNCSLYARNRWNRHLQMKSKKCTSKLPSNQFYFCNDEHVSQS